MSGKDMILNLQYISDCFVEEAEFATYPIDDDRSYRGHRWSFLIAAIIVLLMLLVGCAAYFYSLKQYVVIDNTSQIVVTVDERMEEMVPGETVQMLPQTTTSPFVAENVLSLQGYIGSPSYNALQEWWEYAVEYTARNPELRFSSDYQRPEAYTKYPCYSQEMVDKVDEICAKYGLHLLGKSLFITDMEGMEANGLSGVLSVTAEPRCFYGHLYQDGSFVASGELDLSGDYERIVQFQMHYIRKDAFYTTHLGMNNMSEYMQWNYVTPDGYNALLALSDKTGLIFAENEGHYISVIIEEVPDEHMVFSGLPKEKQFLEAVCNCFVFMDFMIS